MFSKSISVSLAAIALSVTSLAKADPWADAQALYDQREDNRDQIHAAQAAYEALLASSTSVDDKVLAATQLGRLALYEGEMLLPKSDTAGRKVIFEHCWNDLMPKIGPDAIGQKVPQYYYFRGACLGWWGEAAGPAQSLMHLSKLKEAMREGVLLDMRFEGGGMHRLIAGIRSNPLARNPLLGLYDIEEAKAQAAAALTEAAYPGDANNGASYYENLRTEAQVLKEDGQAAAAKDKYTAGIALIERQARINRLPAGRGPESRWVLGKMKVELEQLGH